MTGIFSPLATSRLILRVLESGDAAEVARLMTPSVARWLASWPAPMTLEMASARIGKVLAFFGEGKALPLAIVRASDSRFLGWIEIVLTPEGQAGLGYWLGQDFQGHGYMREAAPAAVAAGAEYLGVHEVIAGCQPHNAASIAVLEACGLRFTGERMYFAAARGREEPTRFYGATADQLRVR